MIDIKDIQGNTRFSTGINPGAKGKFSLMKEDYVVLPFNTLSPIDFQVGDYVDLRGALDASLGGKLAKIYQIVDIPYPTYKNGGYSYELRLDAYYFKWKTKIFKYTPEYGGQEASWNLTASLDVQMGVFLRNLKALGYKYEGKDFVFSIDDSVENSSKLMTYDNTNLIDAMFSMADNWGCDCWVTDHVINFGRCEFSDAVKIELDKEAKDMSRSDSKGTYATRIYAFGSTRNIPTNYRPVDQTTVVNGIVQKRLMLPAGIPYVDAREGLTDLEAIEAVVVFDDIYPKRVGEITGVSSYESEVDNEDGTKTKATFYRFKDSGINFSKEYILEGQELKIRFESGKLNGMEFGVAFNPLGLTEKNDDGTFNPDAQLWEIVQNEDYGRPLPDEVLFPAIGDKYVLSGWNAEKITELGLVATAEQELLAAAKKYVAKTCIDDGAYTATLNSIWVHGDPINHSFDIGQRINLINPAYFKGGRLSRVIGFEIKLDKPYDSPQYTIGESTAYSRLSDIETQVEELTFKGQTFTGSGGSNIYVIKTNDATAASNFNVFSALRTLRMFLRKDFPDVAEEIITFLKGLLIGKNGSGITVREDGTSQAVVDRLYVKIKAVFEELQVKKATHVGGEQIITHAGMKCIRVEELEDVYRCYFLAEQEGEAIANEFSVGSFAQAKECNIVDGTTLNASNRYYWREVMEVGRDYIDLSKTICDEGSDIPQAGDDIIGLGHRTDVDLQSAIVLSSTNETSPSITFYAGINDFNLTEKDIISFGLDKSTGHAYMKVYGTSYIGARDESTYIKYTPEGGVEIKGRFLTMAGEDILTMFTVIEGLIKSEISSVRDEINALDNYLNNASFAADMQYWTGSSNIRIFRVDGRLLYFNNNFYANKESFADIVTEGVKSVLRLKNSYIEQVNSDFYRHPDFEVSEETFLKRARQFGIAFKYLVKRPGTLTVHFKNENKDGFEEYDSISFSKDLYPTGEFKPMDIIGKWNGTGDFYMSFTGDIYIYSLTLTDDALADLREEFNMRFELTDKKIQANLDEIKSTAGKLEEYHSEFLLTARNLEAKFTEDLTNTESRVTEAYASAIDLSARGLRAEFSSSLSDLDGKLTNHLSSFHVTAEKIDAMVSATDSINNRIASAGWITTADGNKLWATISTVNGIDGRLTSHEASFHVTAQKIEGIVADITEQGTNYSKLTQTVSGISANVSDVTGKYSTLKIEVDSIRGIVGDGSGGTFSEFQQSIREITQRVTSVEGGLTSHEGSFHVTAEKIESLVTATNSLKDTVEEHSSAISQTSTRIDQFVQKITFDTKGNITNIDRAGLVTESNIATVFAQKVDPYGEIVRRAEISAFITEDKAGNLISNATIQADKINFTGKTIINGKFIVDTNGNLTLDTISVKNVNKPTDPFYIDSKGVFHGKNVVVESGTFNGTITANDGNLAGWIIDVDSIHKNNVVLGSDGSIYNQNGSWYLGNNNTGYLANGNITWDTSGDVVLNNMTANGTINASSGRIGSDLYLHSSGISTNPNNQLVDFNDETSQFSLSKSYYMHGIMENKYLNMLTIRPYCFKESEPGYSTSPAVLSISAAIEGRKRAIHVSAGESYFGDKCSFAGDMMIYGKLTTPSSRALEIDAPVSTRGVNTRFITASGSVNVHDDFLRFTSNSNITMTMPSPSSCPGKVYYVKQTAGSVTFTNGPFVAPNGWDTNSTYKLTGTYSMMLVSDGSSWFFFYCG
jgi:hypothetical protein|uniref:Tail protein n=1 Tax=Myoviridae sp. ctcPl3 TaxID=2826669 RepID=A0A8S5QWC0_9CAUD|nr:MAG TPA: tail protein [Myoviridae sp. ctcPl3]